MYPVFKKTYDYFENIRGKKLLTVSVLLVILSLTFGVLIGQIPTLLQFKQETQNVPKEVNGGENSVLIEKSGRVVFVDPSKYPGEGISYKLIDEKSGKDITLLRASDDKLKFIEGGVAKLRGKSTKTSGGEDVLFVEKIVFK